MNLEKKIKSVLEAGTGVKCYAMQKPLKGDVPCTVYNVFPSDPVVSQSGADKLSVARVQITHIAKTAASLRTLTKAVENTMFYNSVDFEVALPSIGMPTMKEDKLYFSTRDYLIHYLRD